MFQKNDKRRLYWLLDQYLTGNIDEGYFCNEFYYSYCLEISDNELTELEKKAFSELDKIASRFSEFESDHINLPNGFYTKEELKEQIVKTRIALQKENPLNNM